MEQLYGDEMDENENEEINMQKMVTTVGVVEPLDVNPSAGVIITDDDALDFIADHLTD
jgi:hypothetical protein